MLTGSGDKLKTPIKNGDRINGLLDRGCTFDGKLSFEGTVQINGDFNGEINSDGILVIGNEGCVNAKIKADTVVIFGKVRGTIEAKSRIEMKAPAVVVADLKTHTLSVEDGVIFHGASKMEHDDVVEELKVTSIASAKKEQAKVAEESVM